MVLFEPGIGTLEALEREFSRRSRPILLAASRSGNDKAFSQASLGGEDSLRDLALRIGELRVKLGLDFYNTLAGRFNLACMRWAYGDPPPDAKPGDDNANWRRPTVKELADELLALPIHDDS